MIDPFQLNKIAGAFLGTLLFVLSVTFIGQAIFAPPKVEKPGYKLPGAAETTAGAPAGKPAPEAQAAQLFAKADPKKGEADTKPCQLCHNFEKGAGVKIGPPLYGVVGRDKGSVAGFDYSPGMKAKGGKWTLEDIFTFIKDPPAFVSGTKMSFAGEPDPEKRADIVVYLRTLSDNPVPLPAASAEPAKTEPAKSEAKSEPANAAAPPAAAAEGDAGQLVAEADPKKGEADTKPCQLCHNFEKGAGVKIGPPLYGVVGRAKGSVPGFDYSAGMKAKGGNWTFEDIFTFIKDPAAYVSGTKMTFAGEPDPKKRAAIIAYLRTLSDNPVPLPAKK